MGALSNEKGRVRALRVTRPEYSHG
jgi:hypothetical protein